MTHADCLPSGAPAVAAKPPVAWELSLVSAAIMLGNNLFTKITLLACLVYFFLRTWQDIPATFAALQRAPWLVLLQGWAMGSVAWSVVPSVTRDIVLTQTAFCILCLLLARYAVGKDLGASLKCAAYLVVVLVVLYALAFPGQAVSPNGFKAFYPNKNNLGVALALCTLITLYAPRVGWLDLATAAVAMAMLVLSHSKTSLSITLLMGLLALFFHASRSLMARLGDFAQGLAALLGRGVLLALQATIIAGIWWREHIAQFLIDVIPYEFLTGRGELWVTVLRRTSDDLLWGIGPGSFWAAGPLSEIAQTSLFTKHPGWIETLGAADGGYIDMIGSLGFIGLALILLSIAGNARQLARLVGEPEFPLLATLVAFFAFHNVTETTVYQSTNALWFLYLLASFLIALLGERKARQTRDGEVPEHTRNGHSAGARAAATHWPAF